MFELALFELDTNTGVDRGGRKTAGTSLSYCLLKQLSEKTLKYADAELRKGKKTALYL